MTLTHIGYEAADVKAACADRMAEVLHRFGVPVESLDGKGHACPKCGGDDRFAVFPDFERTGGCYCRRCDAKAGDIIASVQWLTDKSFKQALNAIGDAVNAPKRNGRQWSNGKPAGERESILAVVCRMKSIPPKSLKAYGCIETERIGKKGKSFPVVRVPVYNAIGEPVSHFDLTERGKGLCAAGGQHGLFLPVERKPQSGETWLIVEGVKDAAALHSLGYLAAGLPTNQMSNQFAEAFKGCNAVFVPDRDTPSLKGFELSAARVFGIAESIRIAHLPGAIKSSNGDDVRDIIRDFGADAVHKAIKAASDWKLPEPDPNNFDAWSLLQDEHQTDHANARRLIRMSPFPVRWCGKWKSWLWWDGRQWAFDESCIIDSLGKDVSREMWTVIDAVKVQHIAKGDDAVKAIVRPYVEFAKYSASLKGVVNASRLARSEPGVAVAHDQFDADPWLLNVENGTIDLKTGEKSPHDPLRYQTKLAPTEFHASAECPRWSQFIFEIMGDDQQLANYLQRLVGFSLAGVTTEHVLPILYGSGANGKSVFLNTIHAMLGDGYAMKAPHDFLIQGRGDSHPTAKADLFGRRFVAANEVNEGRRLDEAWVKEATGGDRITARRMRENNWTFTPTHTIWLATNHKPEVRGTDEGVWRRLKLIPFNVRFEGDCADPNLPAKLLAELPGILNWAIQGCQLWQAEGLADPDAVRAATANYRTESDVIGEFIDECCEVGDESYEEYSTPLYLTYQKWALNHGEKVLPQKSFGRRITDRGFPTTRGTGGKWKRTGLRVQPTDDSNNF